MNILFNRLKILLFIIILFGIALLCSSGQELKHEVSVTLKLIQVFVMDGHDKPVTDLRAEDFVVTDNKKTVKVTDFERYILEPAELDSPSGLPKEPAASSIQSPAKTLNRKFFLFFDLANNSTQGFRKAQEAAVHFIDTQLHPADEVGVLTFSVTKGLKLHEYLTKDRNSARSAVLKLGKEGLVGRVENFEAELYRELSGVQALDASKASQPIKVWSPSQSSEGQTGSITQRRPNSTGDSFSGWQNRWAGRMQHKSITTHLIESLSNLSKAMRYIPGHKHMLFFSSGIPNSLIFGGMPGGAGGVVPMDRVLSDRYETMLQEFSNANTSVFSLNTEPLMKNVNIPTSFKGEKTLQKISQFTGGKFLGNVQNYGKIIDTVRTFTGSYYVLGYYVSEAWDGRYHKISVKVNKPGCRVFAQKGYFNPKAFSKYTKMEKQIHLIDLALSENPKFQAPESLPAVAVPRPYENKAAVLLMAGAAERPMDKTVGKNAEIYFLVFDALENLVTLKRREINQAALKNKEASYYSVLPLSPGRYKCRVVVRDMGTGKGAVGKYMVDIPEYPDQGLLLFPPLLLTSEKSGFFVRGYSPKTENKGFPLVDFFPFDPGAYSPLLGEIAGDTSRIQALMHCLVKGLANPQIRFTAQLKERGSGSIQSVPVSFLSGKKDKEVGTVFVELKLPKTRPGNYTLTIKAEDTASGATSQTTTDVRINSPVS
jgi:VWFA-related protein